MKEATLLQKVENYDGIMKKGGVEGLLYVTIVHKQTGQKKTGTVCDNGAIFNMEATRIICKKMGHNVEYGVWGNKPWGKYVPV